MFQYTALDAPQWSSPTPSPLKRTWPFGEDGRDDQSRASTSASPSSSTQTSEISEPIIHDFFCFGSVIDIKAQLSTGNRQLIFPALDRVHSFPVVEEGSLFALEHLGFRFARLTKGLCATFKALVEDRQRQLQFRALVQASDLRDIKAWHYYSKKAFPVEVNIYGLKADAETVGRILSKADIYLQFPKSGLDGYKYSNPHFLQIDGFDGGIPTEKTPTTNQEEARRRSIEPESQTNISTAVDNILDSLSHHVDLGQISVDGRIRSTLLPHQKEAIDFINQRETGKIASELSLWKYNDVDKDEPFYQHVFTGAKRPLPAEARGGIIADEMGLGKSLVILSTIAGSLDRAEEFVAENQGAERQPQREVPSSATLILAPSSLLIDNWVDEIRKHTFPGAISFHRHLGSARHAEIHLLQQRMIVFTTYATVATEYCRRDSPLAKIKWFRIVLDEAHDVRNRATKQYQAVANLPAQHRWCLTGTPIQNNLDDLGALTSFLKVPILESTPTFRKFITTPINSASRNHFNNLRLLLQTICLRRTRELLDLPEPIRQIRRIPLTDLERTEYNNLLLQGRAQIDMAVSGRRKGRVNSTVLESLLKLRLFCNNGNENVALHTGLTGLPEDPDEALSYLQQLDQNVCAYCTGTIYSLNDATDTDGGTFAGKCPHLVCHNCSPQHRAQKQGCPTCVLETNNHSENILSESMPNNEWVLNSYHSNSYPRPYPSKLLALIQDLRRDPTHKSIVFSCWKKTLNLVGDLLNHYKTPFDMIDGSLALNERLKILKDFRSPDGANVLLMTLGTGAVGLNLAVASRVYLLEPQWNPSIESQAIGRALRLGQTEQVKIVRYIMAQTVEECNVLDRQTRKLQLAGGGFGKEKEAANLALDIFRVELPIG
ncbi:uncharacterized protein BDR25DRAFT_305757 [Lindgomyces ingoldianus]|uniref:Uncharacterized protein n=1 Tax=Lindgomyces ingoldianus TaxID=673940 RepID=A0ACB6QJ27_9PLEO|nr:uncharacterized protein BDR25DRAFT_305757 [Lindgomyces ingoldianus]KAF2466886.1 hypothetical protein BDR25DRAFT_305757 [Lindgomyces ingoldianus]